MSRSSPSNCSAWQDCLQHAFEEAAVGIENWEYAGYESEEERVITLKAAKEVAKLIRAMAWRRYLAHHRNQNAGGMARELAAQDSDNTTDSNG